MWLCLYAFDTKYVVIGLLLSGCLNPKAKHHSVLKAEANFIEADN